MSKHVKLEEVAEIVWTLYDAGKTEPEIVDLCPTLLTACSTGGGKVFDRKLKDLKTRPDWPSYRYNLLHGFVGNYLLTIKRLGLCEHSRKHGLPSREAIKDLFFASQNDKRNGTKTYAELLAALTNV